MPGLSIRHPWLQLVWFFIFCSGLVFFLASCGDDSSDKTPANVDTSAAEVAERRDCEARLQERFSTLAAEQLAWYSRSGSGVLPIEAQRARLSIGTSGRAIVVVHGFLSSPAYVSDIVEPLIRDGHTVIVPLLTGYGADAAAANASGPQEWQASLDSAVELMRSCYADLTVIAHSLGAALTTDSVVAGRLTGLSRLVLLSPYYRTDRPWASVLAPLLSSQRDVIDLATFRRFAGGLDPYVVLPIQRGLPGEPEPFLPLPATNRLLGLQLRFREKPVAARSLPTLLIVSEADAVIDADYAREYARAAFVPLEEVIFPASLGIGHSLQQRAFNPRVDEVISAIRGFITR